MYAPALSWCHAQVQVLGQNIKHPNLFGLYGKSPSLNFALSVYQNTENLLFFFKKSCRLNQGLKNRNSFLFFPLSSTIKCQHK